MAAVIIRSNPFQAISRLLSAVAIHGIYNFILEVPGLPSIAAVLIALMTLASSIATISGGWSNTEEKSESDQERRP
jgi:RsiW-degrading membrane proteinase PrsW (M82 family)